jgi:hypothetical protein
MVVKLMLSSQHHEKKELLVLLVDQEEEITVEVEEADMPKEEKVNLVEDIKEEAVVVLVVEEVHLKVLHKEEMFKTATITTITITITTTTANVPHLVEETSVVAVVTEETDLFVLLKITTTVSLRLLPCSLLTFLTNSTTKNSITCSLKSPRLTLPRIITDVAKVLGSSNLQMRTTKKLPLPLLRNYKSKEETLLSRSLSPIIPKNPLRLLLNNPVLKCIV